MHVNATRCPACGQPTLPAFDSEGHETAVCCQNPACRIVVACDGSIEHVPEPAACAK
jgi:hypothetical protein